MTSGVWDNEPSKGWPFPTAAWAGANPKIIRHPSQCELDLWGFPRLVPPPPSFTPASRDQIPSAGLTAAHSLCLSSALGGLCLRPVCTSKARIQRKSRKSLTELKKKEIKGPASQEGSCELYQTNRFLINVFLTLAELMEEAVPCPHTLGH